MQRPWRLLFSNLHAAYQAHKEGGLAPGAWLESRIFGSTPERNSAHDDINMPETTMVEQGGFVGPAAVERAETLTQPRACIWHRLPNIRNILLKYSADYIALGEPEHPEPAPIPDCVSPAAHQSATVNTHSDYPAKHIIYLPNKPKRSESCRALGAAAVPRPESARLSPFGRDRSPQGRGRSFAGIPHQPTPARHGRFPVRARPGSPLRLVGKVCPPARTHGKTWCNAPGAPPMLGAAIGRGPQRRPGSSPQTKKDRSPSAPIRSAGANHRRRPDRGTAS